MNFKSTFIKVGLLGLTFVSLNDNLFSQELSVTTSLLGDRWYYPFGAAGGTQNTGSMFNYKYNPESGEPEYNFNYLDGYIIGKWSLGLPSGIDSNSFKVTSATITLWHTPGAKWNPSEVKMNLWAAGFGPTYTEENWTETSAFVGSQLGPKTPRDPYPRDFIDDSHTEDNWTTATSWAQGVHTNYTTTEGNPDVFSIVFHLDVTNPRIQEELKNDIISGVSSWIFSSNVELGTMGGSSEYPRVYIRGTGVTAVPAAPAAIPRLRIFVQSNASVDDWSCY